MRIIIAPAKKMVADTDSFAADGLPQFLEQAEQLKAALQSMSPRELQALWKCSGAIAKLNVERLEQMDLRRSLTPAILSYDGIQYRYMAPGVMETAHLDYLRERLRILSGFYGLLRPFDGVTPYRLASKEYSKAVESRLPGSVRFVTCVFGELKGGKVIEKGTQCKMARGQMVRWLAERSVTDRADIRAFDQLGYRFQAELSAENRDVFIKQLKNPN